jgi:hypothetical protein
MSLDTSSQWATEHWSTPHQTASLRQGNASTDNIDAVMQLLSSAADAALPVPDRHCLKTAQKHSQHQETCSPCYYTRSAPLSCCHSMGEHLSKQYVPPLLPCVLLSCRHPVQLPALKALDACMVQQLNT